MGKLNIVGGKIMLIRNCQLCGGKAELRHGMSTYLKDHYSVKIKCSDCENNIFIDYVNRDSKDFSTKALITAWNRRRDYGKDI